MQPRFFDRAAAFRRWLTQHHTRAGELLVGFYKKASGKPTVTYHEALDEALCFGWIDGIRKSFGPDRYTIRFTPRKPTSIWSQVNITRAKALVASGRMTAAGLRAFETRDEQRAKLYSYERETARFDPDLERTFKSDPRAWEFCQAQPPGYRRIVTWFVMSAKKPETRAKRLETVIRHSRAGRRLPMMGGKGSSET
jgi:uncharacterized protein YdeI (YjbR/CyaY-like superfamily)